MKIKQITKQKKETHKKYKQSIPDGLKIVKNPKKLFPYDPDSKEGKQILDSQSEEELRVNYCIHVLSPCKDSDKEVPCFYWCVKKTSKRKQKVKRIPKNFLRYFHKAFSKKFIKKGEPIPDVDQLECDEITGYLYDPRFIEDKSKNSEHHLKESPQVKHEETIKPPRNKKKQEKLNNSTWTIDLLHIKMDKTLSKQPEVNPTWNDMEMGGQNFPLKNPLPPGQIKRTLMENKAELGHWKPATIMENPNARFDDDEEPPKTMTPLLVDENNLDSQSPAPPYNYFPDQDVSSSGAFEYKKSMQIEKVNQNNGESMQIEQKNIVVDESMPILDPPLNQRPLDETLPDITPLWLSIFDFRSNLLENNLFPETPFSEEKNQFAFSLKDFGLNDDECKILIEFFSVLFKFKIDTGRQKGGKIKDPYVEEAIPVISTAHGLNVIWITIAYENYICRWKKDLNVKYENKILEPVRIEIKKGAFWNFLVDESTKIRSQPPTFDRNSEFSNLRFEDASKVVHYRQLMLGLFQYLFPVIDLIP